MWHFLRYICRVLTPSSLRTERPDVRLLKMSQGRQDFWSGPARSYGISTSHVVGVTRSVQTSEMDVRRRCNTLLAGSGLVDLETAKPNSKNSWVRVRNSSSTRVRNAEAEDFSSRDKSSVRLPGLSEVGYLDHVVGEQQYVAQRLLKRGRIDKTRQ